MARLIDHWQAATMLTMRALPKVRGHGRAAALINRCSLRLGATPIVTVELRQGHRLILDARVQSQARAAFSGNYDNPEIAILCGVMKAGAVALDVGANIGFYTVPLGYAARRWGGRVLAFEPLPANYRRLTSNVELNALESEVELQMIGLSAAAGTADLALREDFEGGGEVGNASVVINDGMDARFARTQINLARLDDLWPRLGQTRLDVVKIDIEGHEDEFLYGARETLERNRPIILIEVNRWFYQRRGIDFDRAIPRLLPPRYDFYRAKPSTLRWLTRNGFRGVERVGGMSEFGDLENALLVPSEKAEELRRVVEELRDC